MPTTTEISSCTVAECTRPAKARGWCGTHYSRWLNYGDPHHVNKIRRGRSDPGTCKGCDVIKTEETTRITKRVGSRAYWVTYCRACSRERNDEWRTAHRQELNNRQSEKRAEIRREAVARYGGACACCGETRFEFLTIDHVNGGGTKHRATVGQEICRWLRREGFPDGYQVLCYNCNCSMAHAGYCPHEEE